MVEMKKLKTLSLLVLSLVVGLLPTYAQAASPRLWVNGRYITGDVAPIVRNNRTLVPMRQVSEALGLDVEWNQEAQQALVTIDDVVYTFMPDKPYYGAGDSKVDMDTTTVVYNNRIFLPLRVIAEATGSKVSWDQTSYTAVVGEGYIPGEATVSNNTFEEVVVERVIDGDTIVVSGGQKVRLILVDTPETKHPTKGVEYFGKEASEFTRNNLEGKTVYLEKDVSETDKYGRLLRYVWIARPSSDNPTKTEIGNMCFNAALLSGGYARLATFPPDVKYVDFFRTLENQARQSNAGLWGNGGAAPEATKPTPQKPVAKPKASAPTKTYNSNPINAPYIGNSNTGKFHKRGCRSVQKMSPHNMVGFSSRSAAIGQGYSPCGRCHP